MAQRHDITKITFQANARGANAAIESLRQEAEKCNQVVTDLKAKLKDGIKMGKSTDELDKIRADINAASKDAKQWSKAHSELIKGMSALDKGIKAFNDGTLNQMSAAFQKTLYNAAKLTRMKLAPDSETYKKDFKELTAVMDAAQQNFAKLQGDAASMIKTLNEGGKVSVAALRDEINAQKELQSVLSETDKGYKRTEKNIAVLESYLRAMGGDYEFVRKNIQDTQKVSDEMLRNMYTELQKTNAEGKVTKDIMRENARAMKEIRAEQARRVEDVLGGDLTKQSEGSIRTAINNAKELLLTYKTGSKEAQALSAQIVNAEEHLKTHGTEAARAAQKQAEAMKLLDDKYKMMQGRMADLTKLSKSALDETQKFWQAQMDGAIKGSRAYKEAERNLKAIAAEQERLNKAQLQTSANKIGRKNLATLSEQELTTSIAAAKQLAASMKPTDAAYKQLVDDIVRAEEHVKQFGLEGQRSARQTADQMKVMEDRMKNVKTLSNSALEETRRFWQAQMDGAQRGSQAYKQAEANLKQLTAEQQRLVNEQNKTQANQLMRRGNLSTMSEGSIRQAIEAAKQYQQTLSTTDPVYQRLTKAIVNAEEHLKKYGLEAERAARKEIEAAKKAADERKKTDKMMHDQLKQGTALSDSALKAQQQYWQRLIDDPKTAATSLKKYEAELQKVKQIQDQLVQNRGKDALAFFRGDTSNASASQIQEQAKALKAYRDSLPQKTHATTIAEIDEILKKVGMTAQKAAAETMSFKQAMQVSAQAGKGQFKGTVEQLTQAKKVLEEMSAKAVKGGLAWRRMQEALQRIELELKNVGHLSKEVQAVLDAPKGKSFNALKQAVEQGRAALNNMDRTTKEGQLQFDLLAKKIKAADFELKQLAGTAKGSATAFEKAWSRLKTYITLYMGAAVAIQKVVATFGDLIDLSDKLGEVRKTTGFSVEEVGRLSDSLKKLDTRSSINSLLELSVAAGQLGLKTQEDVEGFTVAANKLMVALPEMGKEGATEMMKVALATGEIKKIQEQMNQGLIDGSSATAVAMEKVGSTIDRLRATSAATAPAITDFVKRVGAVGAQSGISIDQVAALGSTVDALGMRVEMSATALSRMIPAIKNNAFDVAKAIGVTPNTLRELFETGRGMEAILMIFQKIKDSGMGADDIDKMLGMGNMKEVMKELNQQGARAGIVFAGLSQNVDELRRQLGVAATAYKENIAIQQEYDKMNETTAAKWERLKNQLEEFFVGDASQRFLGGIIDGLRVIVDLLTGNVAPALKWITDLVHLLIIYWSVLKVGLGEALFVKAAAGLKTMGSALVNLITNTQRYIELSRALRTARLAEAAATTAADKATAAHNVTVIEARMAQEGLNKALIANVWTAVIAAVVMLTIKIYGYIKATKEAQQQMGQMAAEFVKAEQAVEKNFKAIDEANKSIEESNKKLKEAQDNLKKAKDSLDGTKESTENLTKAEEDLKKAEDEVRIANDAHRSSIALINKEYGSYLGFMLSEISSAAELANARELINQKLREGIILRRKEAAVGRVEEKEGKERDEAYGELGDLVRGLKITETTIEKKDENGNTVTETIKVANTADNERALNELTKVLQDESFTKLNSTEQWDKIEEVLNEAGYEGKVSSGFATVAMSYAQRFKEVDQKVSDTMRQYDVILDANRESGQQKRTKQLMLSSLNYDKLLREYEEANGKDEKQKAAANLLKQMDTIEEMNKNADQYFNLENAEEKMRYEMLKATGNKLLGRFGNKRDALVKEAGKLYKPAGGGGGGGGAGGGSPWGSNAPAESTDYATWDVNELVARREQMDKFKNILKPDTNIRAVLAEDKALMKALDNGLKEDWKAVLNWYNQERLKIQEELKSERKSTNQGHWRDDKKSGGRKNHFKESDYALAELDRYYSKRKEGLEKARIEENMSEEVFNRQAELLEQEHLERRSKLRETFTAGNTKEEQEMVKQFREWWSKLEKEGKLDEVPWATVESEWAKALASEIGRNNLKAQEDLTKMEQITVKHLNAIAKIIEKERPYDGIVANLRKNLTDMDILLADVQKNGPTEDPALLMKEQNTRLQFLLGEAETAHQSSIDDVLKRMADAGMTAWAEEIGKSDAMKNALMAQLQTAYDEIQNAIKKEASQIKKQTDIWWNDLMPGQDTSRKGGFEKMLSSLGLQEDQVKRANSLINAGQASERVADKLAIKQMQIRLQMQQVYYQKMREMWDDRIRSLREQGKEIDAQHAEISKQLSLSEEQKKLDEQRVAIANQLEESQNRLYTELKEWGDLLYSSMKDIFEASHAGDAEYYNERAKMNLTGKGGPGAGTYIVIDNEGTEDATAHYEYLDERQALERQREIERENAQAEAWKKMWDDLNQKLSETITDQLNAALQNVSIDANTNALGVNTAALGALSAQLAQGITINKGGDRGVVEIDNPTAAQPGAPETPAPFTEEGFAMSHETSWINGADYMAEAEAKKEISNSVLETIIANKKKAVDTETQGDRKIQTSTQSTFAKMTLAANMYGAAYQAMSNENLSTTEKFEMMALQAVGNYAIGALTTELAGAEAKAASDSPGVLGTLWKQLGWAAAPVFAIFTGLLGGLMGLASSKIGKAKSTIAQATGASVNAGRLATGMMTYAEGNVNEFTDPGSLKEGRQYNVDGADGRTYRARYMGKGAKTHITNGPEFHLVGERGREAIIDAHTTRNIQLNEPEIWRSIQTLYNGGSLRHSTRRGYGMAAYAEGNLDEFDMSGAGGMMAEGGFSPEMMTQMQAALDRNSAVMETIVQKGIKAYFDVYGKGGLVDSYDTGKKTVKRHGERY